MNALHWLAAGLVLLAAGCGSTPPATPKPAAPSEAAGTATKRVAPQVRTLAMHVPMLAPPDGTACHGTRRIDVVLRSASNPRAPRRRR